MKGDLRGKQKGHPSGAPYLPLCQAGAVPHCRCCMQTCTVVYFLKLIEIGSAAQQGNLFQKPQESKSSLETGPKRETKKTAAKLSLLVLSNTLETNINMDDLHWTGPC